MAKIAQKQEIKRVIIEAIIKILEFEGRLPNLNRCIVCNKNIEKELSLTKTLFPTHPNCSNLISFPTNQIKELFINKTTILIEDENINSLYSIILKGF